MLWFLGPLALVVNRVTVEKYFLTRRSGKPGVHSGPPRMFSPAALRKALKPLQGVTFPEMPPPCGTWALQRGESWERSRGSPGSEQLQRNLFLHLPNSC